MDGRVALVTGGSRGLGRAMAETFSRAGAKVAIVARRPEVLETSIKELMESTHGTIKGYPGDVGKAEHIPPDLVVKCQVIDINEHIS
jgi:NAD(P)-dependent dehydrogenase (short-subunit alcohol dehydrogenase family)